MKTYLYSTREKADGLDETDSDLGSLLDTLNDIMER